MYFLINFHMHLYKILQNILKLISKVAEGLLLSRHRPNEVQHLWIVPVSKVETKYFLHKIEHCYVVTSNRVTFSMLQFEITHYEMHVETMTGWFTFQHLGLTNLQ